MVVADAKGLRIFSLDTRQVCYQIGVGAVSAAEMLFSTSLLAFVGSGAALSPQFAHRIADQTPEMDAFMGYTSRRLRRCLRCCSAPARLPSSAAVRPALTLLLIFRPSRPHPPRNLFSGYDPDPDPTLHFGPTR